MKGWTKTRSTKRVLVTAAIFVTMLAAHPSAALADCMALYKRNCSGSADCERKRADIRACEANEAALRRAENERAHRRDLEQHQAEVRAVKKIDEANKKVNRLAK